MRKCIRVLLAVCTVSVTVLAWQGPGVAKAPERPLQPQALRGGNLGQALFAADVDGDGSEELVATAPAARGGGFALVFRSSAQGLSEEPWLALAGGESFGWSATALGDANGDGAAEFAVAALDADGPLASACGAVTVFQGGDTPRPRSVLAGEYAFDRFGYALAAGDLNADGATDLVIGAPFHSPSPALYQQGAVYVALGPGYSQATLLKLPATAVNGGVGWSFAVGDVNGDGRDDLLMAATGKIVGFFGGPGFAPSLGAPDLTVSSAATGFGRAIAVTGDLDADGFGDVAIGAARAVAGGFSESGMVFVVKGGADKRSVNLAAPTPDLIAAIGGRPEARFGTSLLALGDIDGDATPDLAVGAVHADAGGFAMTGSVYVLSGKDIAAEDPLALARVIERPAEDLHFGASLALGAGGMAYVGAPSEDANTGRVHPVRLR